jgi:hypothetical protein
MGFVESFSNFVGGSRRRSRRGGRKSRRGGRKSRRGGLRHLRGGTGSRGPGVAANAHALEYELTSEQGGEVVAGGEPAAGLRIDEGEVLSSQQAGGRRRSKRSRKHRKRRGRKGGLSSQLVPLGLLATTLGVGARKSRKSRKSRRRRSRRSRR